VIACFFNAVLNLQFAKADNISNIPMFCKIVNEDKKNEVFEKLKNLQKSENKTFDEAYSVVKKEYHKRINDIFTEKMEKLSKNLYQSEGRSDKLCSPFKFEKETKSLRVGREMLKHFRDYECALDFYIQNPPYSGNEIYFNDGVVRLNTIKSRLRQEIRFSYIAIEKSIQMYNELRLWFPVHRDLLCLIEQMKAYRNALRNFIDQIVRMPAKYYNYGSRYQQ
jgi:hypothetical protein